MRKENNRDVRGSTTAFETKWGWADMTQQTPVESDGTVEHNRSRLEDGQALDRVTFRATDEQLAAIESLVDADVYHNRSDAIRAGIQQLLEHHARTLERERR